MLRYNSSAAARSIPCLSSAQATLLSGHCFHDLSRNFGFLLDDVARLVRTIYDGA